jgi:hypothetical protein
MEAKNKAKEGKFDSRFGLTLTECLFSHDETFQREGGEAKQQESVKPCDRLLLL